MRKKFLLTSLFLSTFLLGSLTVYANSSVDSEIEISSYSMDLDGNNLNSIDEDLVSVSVDTDLPKVTLDDGSIIVFLNQADYNSYLKSAFSNGNGIKGRSIPVYGKNTVISTVNNKQKFVSYHPNTPLWRKASSYNETLGSSVTFSGSVKHNDSTLGFSVTVSKGVTAVMPADANRYSKLGVYCDVKTQYVLCEEFESGTNIKVKSYYTYIVTVPDKYINVVYQ